MKDEYSYAVEISLLATEVKNIIFVLFFCVNPTILFYPFVRHEVPLRPGLKAPSLRAPRAAPHADLARLQHCEETPDAVKSVLYQ